MKATDGEPIKEACDRTDTEVLMYVLDDFSECEGRGVVVIWNNEANETCVTSNRRRCEAVGMVEVAKDILLRKFEAV